jgi:hypothetical protein
MSRIDRIFDDLKREPLREKPSLKAEKCYELLRADLSDRLSRLEKELSEVVVGVGIGCEFYDWLQILSVDEPSSDDRGSYHEFSTNRACIRVFLNQPPGWICGEIRYKHPFARRAYRFAQSFITNQQGEYPKQFMGYLSDMPTNLTKDLAERLFQILLESRITEDDLKPESF